MMNDPIRVLVVDDSAFMRKALCGMLASDPRITVVGTGRNGEEALQKLDELRPDVVTLDVEMPVMNGLAALQRIMETRPLPVLMVSSLTTEGAKETLAALELGAVDYIPKQLDGVATRIVEVKDALIDKIIAAAGAAGTLRRRRTRASLSRPDGQGVKAGSAAQSGPGAHVPGTVSASARASWGDKLVAIGCSTGGPRALSEILPLLPEDFPAGIVIVQHMPKFFTKPFSERMNQICRLDVREASDGDIVKPGVVLIAPGGVQLRVARRSTMDVQVALSSDSEGLMHAPSVDVMMQSVASVYGERGIGVILTGMGHDGLEGMRAIKDAKGRTIAQDEATCVVYGMPKAVVEAGCAEKVVPLPQVVGEIVNMV
ncbi:MAG: chemotaxis response regulator protein-glutamate methylesterase [Nitrospirota bacterium]